MISSRLESFDCFPNRLARVGCPDLKTLDCNQAGGASPRVLRSPASHCFRAVLSVGRGREPTPYPPRIFGVDRQVFSTVLNQCRPPCGATMSQYYLARSTRYRPRKSGLPTPLSAIRKRSHMPLCARGPQHSSTSEQPRADVFICAHPASRARAYWCENPVGRCHHL